MKKEEVMLIQRDDKVEVIQPKQYLGSKNVLDDYQKFVGIIDQQKEEIKKNENNIKMINEQIEVNQNTLKKISKHIEWAKQNQSKILRNHLTKDLIDKQLKEFKYKYDDKLSESQNKAQQFYIFKRNLIKNEEIRNLLTEETITNELDNGDLVKNPF